MKGWKSRKGREYSPHTYPQSCINSPNFELYSHPTNGIYITQILPGKEKENILQYEQNPSWYVYWFNHSCSIRFRPVREQQQNEALVKKYFLQDIRLKKIGSSIWMYWLYCNSSHRMDTWPTRHLVVNPGVTTCCNAIITINIKHYFTQL